MRDSYRRENGTTVMYMKLNQKVQIHEPVLCLGQIADMWCEDSALLEDCKRLKLHSFPREKKGRFYYDVVELISILHQRLDITLCVEVLGDESGFAEYIPGQPDTTFGKMLETAKIVIVCLICFCGGAFAIMTFNKDVNVDDILSELHTFVTGRASDGFSVTQLGYCIGIPVGILGFFVHFKKEKKLSDPTPFQVQLREYEQEVNETIMINHERQKNGNN